MDPNLDPPPGAHPEGPSGGDPEGPSGSEIEGGDFGGVEAGARHVRPVDKWRQNTASGGVAAAFALGFRQVLDPERHDTIGVEQPVSTDPVNSEGVELHFDPLSASETVVVVRPPADGQ